MIKLSTHWGWGKDLPSSEDYDEYIKQSDSNFLYKILSLNLSTIYPSSIYCNNGKRRYKFPETIPTPFNSKTMFKHLFILNKTDKIRDFEYNSSNGWVADNAKDLINQIKIFIKLRHAIDDAAILMKIKGNLKSNVKLKFKIDRIISATCSYTFGEIVKKVLESLSQIKVKKIILDPVMIAKGGEKLIDNKAIQLVKKRLLQKVNLVTPNIPEAEVITGIKINSKQDMIKAGKKLITLGAKNVLIKGGHLKSKKVVDIYLNKRELKIFVSSRHNTKNTHGTGCTLSSAITTFFSCGKSIKSACELGIKYVNSAILTNPKYGKGHGPINHLNSILLDKRFN